MQPEAPRQRGFLQPWPVHATSLWAGPPAVGQLSTGRPRETSAFIAFPVHVAPQPADALNSREVLFPLPQGPGPSLRLTLPSGRCAPEWLPTHRGRIAGCPCVPFWAPLSGPAASALPPSSSGNPLTYLNYLSSSVSAKKWGRFIIGSVKYLPWFISLPLEPLKKLHFCATFGYD